MMRRADRRFQRPAYSDYFISQRVRTAHLSTYANFALHVHVVTWIEPRDNAQAAIIVNDIGGNTLLPVLRQTFRRFNALCHS